MSDILIRYVFHLNKKFFFCSFNNRHIIGKRSLLCPYFIRFDRIQYRKKFTNNFLGNVPSVFIYLNKDIFFILFDFVLLLCRIVFNSVILNKCFVGKIEITRRIKIHFNIILRRSFFSSTKGFIKWKVFSFFCCIYCVYFLLYICGLGIGLKHLHKIPIDSRLWNGRGETLILCLMRLISFWIYCSLGHKSCLSLYCRWLNVGHNLKFW